MYNLDSYKEPFWAKSGNFVRGRDPIGVQNSSISVYATLLPGMTNLTLRLRYYGMYLWLLDEYHNLPTDSPFKQSPKAQYTLGAIYYLGVGVPSDFNEAFRWISLSANQGYLDAQHNLAEMYETGKGVPKNLEKFFSLSFRPKGQKSMCHNFVSSNQ